MRARNSSGDSGWTNSPAAGPFAPPTLTPTPTPEPDPTPTPTPTAEPTAEPDETKESAEQVEEAQGASEEGATGQANSAPYVHATADDHHAQITGADSDCYKNHQVWHLNGETSYFTDPDGDTLTITSSTTHPGLASISQHDPVMVDADHPADTWITVITIATDPGGLKSDPGFVWKFNMTCTSALSVNENSPFNTWVGGLGLYNSGGSNYTLESDSGTDGDAAAAFTVSNGDIKVKCRRNQHRHGGNRQRRPGRRHPVLQPERNRRQQV